jgi:DNA invertase Pin-like site-specific DNA recombinase
MPVYAERFRDCISGAKGRDKRPGLDRLLNDAQRRKFDVIMAWAIDRLGRSLIDLLGTFQTLHACGVDVYLDQQSIDTATPAGKLMYQVCGAFAEFERSRRASSSVVGIDAALEKRIQAQLRTGKGMLKVARECPALLFWWQQGLWR